MHFKRRGNRISLYRSQWVPKGPNVPNGYTHQSFVGSIDANALAMPPDLAALLTPKECELVERRIIAPAVAERESAIKHVKQLAVDPVWRLDEALRLINEAATCSLTSAVSATRTEHLRAALEKVKTEGSAPAAHPAPVSDPLKDALSAIAAATQAVQRGRYGRGPEKGFRKTAVFRRWTEILAAVDGSDNSLLRALQNAGFASRRTN